MSKVTITLEDREGKPVAETVDFGGSGPNLSAFGNAAARLAAGKDLPPGFKGLTDAEILTLIAMNSIEDWQKRHDADARAKRTKRT